MHTHYVKLGRLIIPNDRDSNQSKIFLQDVIANFKKNMWPSVIVWETFWWVKVVVACVTTVKFHNLKNDVMIYWFKDQGLVVVYRSEAFAVVGVCLLSFWGHKPTWMRHHVSFSSFLDTRMLRLFWFCLLLTVTLGFFPPERSFFSRF